MKRGDQIRIVNDSGIGRKTQVTLEDGTPLRMLRGALVKLHVSDVVTAQLEVLHPSLDVRARVDRITGVCALCGHREELEEVGE